MDLRNWLEAVDALGELKIVTGASEDTEIGAIAGLLQEKMEGQALLCDHIPGFPEGYRILNNTMTSTKRIAYSLGLPTDLSGLALVEAIKDGLEKLQPLPERWVEDGPIKENIFLAADVNLLSLPVPKLHEHDGGKYLGTGCAVIMRDPENGWVNVGTYRVMLSDSRTCTIHINAGRHGWHIRNKYWQSGASCPMAVVIGDDPLLYLFSGMEMPWNENEIQLTGGWRNERMSVIKGPVTGLPIPANAEIAIEAMLPPGKVLPEGPFGEWRGYYSRNGGGEEPAVEVCSLLHRHHPIILSSIPAIPPSDTTYPRGFLRAGLIWSQLVKANVPGVTGCWIIPWGGDRPFLAVSMTQLYPGHSIQVGMQAATCQGFNYGGVNVVVVDSDIDITSLEQIAWALSTRFNPDSDLHVIPRVWGNAVFKSSALQTPGFSSRVVIDATIPWEMRGKVPKRVKVGKDWAKQVKDKWPGLFV